MYVVIRITDGKYVAKPGQPHSYTRRLENADLFRDLETAIQGSCPENERPVNLDSILRR